MIQKIKKLAFIVAATLVLAAPALLPVGASAACSGIANQVSKGANGAAEGSSVGGNCDSPTGVDDDSITKLANDVVNIFSLIVGVVAVIMIVYGGFRYITSGGDSGSVGNAKNTLIYAIVGLIIVALAQLIVHFVLTKTGSAVS